MEYIVFKVLGIIGALVLVAIDVMIIWCGILKLKDFILKRKHGKLFLYYQGRADVIEECHKAICDYMYSNNIHLIKIAKEEADTPIYPYKVADEICEQLKEKKNE